MDALLRVPGVGAITTIADNFSMRVWMNPDKMSAYSLTPAEVIDALNEQNLQVAAGSAGVPPAKNTNLRVGHTGEWPAEQGFRF